MSETNLQKKAKTLEVSPRFKPYSKVLIQTGLQDDDGNDIVYEAGDDTGRTLEIKNEWATQEMADDIFARIKGQTYQPYTSDGTFLDPAAEIGDTVNVNGVTSGIYTRKTTFGTLMASDISAPNDEEITHEYGYEASKDRQYTRALKETKSTLKIQATQIAAKVESSGGIQSSFGWVLTNAQWALYSGNQEVLRVNSEGLYVNGNGEFTGVVKASQFLNSAGQQMATQDQINAVMGSYAAGGIGGGTFFNKMESGDTSATARWILGQQGSFTRVDCFTLGVGAIEDSNGTLHSNVMWRTSPSFVTGVGDAGYWGSIYYKGEVIDTYWHASPTATGSGSISYLGY